MIELKILDGQYVVGGGGACKQEEFYLKDNSQSYNGAYPKGTILQDKYVIGGDTQNRKRYINSFNQDDNFSNGELITMKDQNGEEIQVWKSNDSSVVNTAFNGIINFRPVPGCGGCVEFKEWYEDKIGNWQWNDCSEIIELTLDSDFEWDMPDSIGSLYSLLKLNVQMSNLKSLSPCIGNLTSLYYLDANGNNIKYLPDTIEFMKNLEYINLEFNEIERITSNISFLKKLKYLNLSNNSFNYLPDAIGELESLETLILSQDYSLTSLPDSIGNLTNLKELRINNNYAITELPNSIGNLTNLENLYAPFTGLSSLPDSIKNLDNETIYVSLYYCRFSDDYKDHIRNDLFPIANAHGHLNL